MVDLILECIIYFICILRFVYNEIFIYKLIDNVFEKYVVIKEKNGNII